MSRRIAKIPLTMLLLAGLGSAVSGQAPGFDLPPEPNRSARGGDPRITGCNIDLVDDIECPSPEEGIIVLLGVKEGTEIRAEEVIAQIDDREAKQGLKIAEVALKAAEARAENDVEKRYSQAAADVALAEVDEMLEANRQVPGAISPAEIRRGKLEFRKATLGIDKAMNDQYLAGLDADTKRAELDAQNLAVDRRKVLAPFDGQILEVFRDQSEWVRPGDPIVRIARLDKLQVDGWVYFRDHKPSEVDGCEVTIQVGVGRGGVTDAAGRVVYVSPLAEGDRDNPWYRVRAEIVNRRQGGRWLISPGLEATMTIHLGTGGAQLGADTRRRR